ncbi:MAG TPA: SLBB domain-containing protein [Candidatus Limnocylindrales bacterium]|nr:SLBB domain-containing protein [Candidatus Limnocylindrales bacterium]
MLDPSPPIAGRVDPATYRVGPGDEFAIRYSDLVDPRILRVGPEGDLVLPDVGPLSVAGLTLNELEARVRERMRPYVRGRGFVFSLYRPRRFRLYVTGEVERPGAVTLQAPVRASEAIEAAGGVAWSGAHRGIQIRRGTDTLRVDLVLASRGGDLATDPLVFESDVLFVPPLGRHVEVFGAVAHPGRYDFAAGDRMSTLVALAGGALPEAALTDATIERFDAAGGSERAPAHLDQALASPGGGGGDPDLREGDRLFVPGRARWMQGDVVVVEGEIARPGPYPIRSGEDRLRAVLALAGGFTSFADSAATRVERSDAASRDTAFLHLAERSPDLLSASDREYVVTASRERRAISANVGRLLARGDPLGDVPLHDGDRIVVPRRVPLVSVQGQVKAPGYVPYTPGRDVSDYVKEAGGYTSRAHRGRVSVTLAATGAQVSADEAGDLRPGDVVWVPTRPDRSTWSTVRDVLTTAAQVATVYLVVHQATK